MNDITKILNDETLTSEQKAEKINQINVELTNRAVQDRLGREKEKQEKQNKELFNSKSELEKRLELLEKQRKDELELRYKDKYKDKYKEALERREKGYLEEDIDLLFKPIQTELQDFKKPDLDKKVEEKEVSSEEKEKENKLKKLIEANEKWESGWN